jgi:hypothetical protein
MSFTAASGAYGQFGDVEADGRLEPVGNTPVTPVGRGEGVAPSTSAPAPASQSPFARDSKMGHFPLDPKLGSRYMVKHSR